MTTREELKPAVIARYEIEGALPPPVTDTLVLGELARRSAMARYGRLTARGVSAALSGKDASGRPLQGHRHAAYLPTDEDCDGHLDHLTVWTPCGLQPLEVQALASLRELNPGRGFQVVRCRSLAICSLRDLPRGLPPHFRTSRFWRSFTPFLPTRHPKRSRDGRPKRRPDGRQVDGVEDQIVRGLALRDYPAPDSITHLSCGPQGIEWRAFQCRREGGGGRRGPLPPVGVRLVFPEPVAGPLFLGYGCHFGLGLFLPEGLGRDGTDSSRQETPR